jgi:hypothetical protein
MDDTRALIDLVHLINGVRENMRAELALASEDVLASVVEQIRDYPQECSDEAFVLRLLSASLTAALVHEARCEMARRLPS